MPVGLEVYSETGVLQLGLDTMPFNLVASGTFTISYVAIGANPYFTTIVVPSSLTAPMIALVKNDNTACWLLRGYTSGSDTLYVVAGTSTGAGSYYIFDYMPTVTPSNYGLQVYSASSTLLYSSPDSVPMRIVGFGTSITGLPSGRTYAAIMDGIFPGTFSDPTYGSLSTQESAQVSATSASVARKYVRYEPPSGFGLGTWTYVTPTISDTNPLKGKAIIVDVTNLLPVSPPPPPPPPPPTFSISKSGDATATRSGSGSITTNSVTITPTNASGAVTYGWALTSGDNDFTVTSPTSASSTFTATFTAPDSASSTYTVTGLDSLGATATVNVGVTASATSSFTPVTVTRTSGTGATETVPTGATSVRIRVGGGGGAGGCRGSVQDGGGGGEGGFTERTIAVIGGNTMTYTVGALVAGRSTGGTGTSGNASSVSGTGLGPLANINVSMTANGGAGGQSFSGGAGGTATGGSTNTTGAAGNDSASGGAGGSGNSTQSGAGGQGSLAPTQSGDGERGEIEFYYT